jgi:hypothetical protein
MHLCTYVAFTTNMSRFNTNILVLLQIALFITTFDLCHARYKRASVMISNVSKGNFTVHCKSADDDLGFHVLSPNGPPYHFEFTPNFFRTTQFYCRFQWPHIIHWFDIYIFVRDHPLCSICKWDIFDEGPCLHLYHDHIGGTDNIDYYRYRGLPERCYPWNDEPSKVLK